MYFGIERTCKKNDRAARKHPKQVPTADNCLIVKILGSEFTKRRKIRRNKCSNLLPVKVVVFQIYPSKILLKLSSESTNTDDEIV